MPKRRLSPAENLSTMLLMIGVLGLAFGFGLPYHQAAAFRKAQEQKLLLEKPLPGEPVPVPTPVPWKDYFGTSNLVIGGLGAAFAAAGLGLFLKIRACHPA